MIKHSNEWLKVDAKVPWRHELREEQGVWNSCCPASYLKTMDFWVTSHTVLFWERAKETHSLDAEIPTAAWKPFSSVTGQTTSCLVCFFSLINKTKQWISKTKSQTSKFIFARKYLKRGRVVGQGPQPQVPFCFRISHSNSQDLLDHHAGHQENIHPLLLA